MNKTIRQALIPTLLLLLPLLYAVTPQKRTGIDAETVKVMPFVKDAGACAKCHGPEELKNRPPKIACDRFCIDCHGKKLGKAHHRVGMKLDFKRPEQIRLIRDRLACISCHDLGNMRFSDRAWKAQSLFGRIFKSKPKYRTYYLIINNKRGALCKRCH